MENLNRIRELSGLPTIELTESKLNLDLSINPIEDKELLEAIELFSTILESKESQIDESLLNAFKAAIGTAKAGIKAGGEVAKEKYNQVKDAVTLAYSEIYQDKEFQDAKQHFADGLKSLMDFYNKFQKSEAFKKMTPEMKKEFTLFMRNKFITLKGINKEFEQFKTK
jgi:hypothetical protein